MSEHLDPELRDALENDPELMRFARLLSSAQSPEPPLDDAFKSALRRQLMDQAWDTAEGRNAWWRSLFMPRRMAWVGAAAMVVLVAAVVLNSALQPPAPVDQVIVGSNWDGKADVATAAAIPVRFNRPMDHESTQAAVQIAPATTVTYSWSGDTVMYVQPKSGNLAPNTQYQVTIGPGARTLNGSKTTAPQTVTFVTGTGEPTPSPSPSPSPTPTASTGALTGVAKLTGDYPPSGTTYAVVWSSDSATVYFVGAGGALESVPVKGGAPSKLVPDGVSLPAMAPAGDRLAYVRNGKIQILDLAGGTTAEIAVPEPPTALRWVKDRLYWGGGSGLFKQTLDGPVKLADTSALAGPVISIAPDGMHAVVQSTDTLAIVDSTSGRSQALCGGGCATAFEGWAPDGSRVVLGSSVTTIVDLGGHTVSSVPAGDPSWSTVGWILLGSDTQIAEVRPDGTGYTPLATGTFHQPVWAPDAATFAFVRGSQLWVATAPAPAPPPAPIDQALSVVHDFMDARLKGLSERAMQFLDDSGKAAYSGQSPALIPPGDQSFARFYVLASEIDPSNNSARVVVRLVFKHGKLEQSSIDETLILVRAQATDPYRIDAATASAPLKFSSGPDVVSVKITPTQVDVTFDSDLIPTSISNVTLQDARGAQVTGSVTYADRTVTFSGLQLTPGAHYRLVVMPGVQDVENHNAAGEYDLELVGPAPQAAAGGVTPPPSPSPSQPAVTPSPSASPSPKSS